MIDLSIIIVNWNTHDLLAQCLQSVYDTVQELELEVFVVDNASTDGSAAMVRERFPQVRLIENRENVGFARANNQAVRESTGRHVLLLNSDTLVLPGALAQMVTFINQNPRVGVVGCQLVNPDGSFQAGGAVFPTLASELAFLLGLTNLARWLFGITHGEDHPHEVDWVGGACMLVRKKAIEQCGLLDERYFMFGEEMDWCYRFRQQDWQCYYLPTAHVIHYRGRSTGQCEDRMIVELYQSKIRFWRKHHGPLAVGLLRFSIAVTSLLKIAAWFLLSLLHPKRGPLARSRISSYLALLRLR